MSVNLTINGAIYQYPEQSDQNWGNEATDWAVAVTGGMLQKAGGVFQLLGEVDFGSSYGIKSLYYKSRSSNISTSGQLRFAVGDTVGFRNNANSGDLLLGINGSDQLTFNGQNFLTGGGIVNSDIAAGAAIEFSKMAALTASRVLVSDASGIVVPSSITSTTLSYLDATSSIQTQLNGKLSTSGGTISGSLIISGDLTVNGTTTTINTTNLDVTDKNITVNKGGNDAASEGAGLTVDRTGTKGSLIYASSAASKFKVGNLGSEVEIVDLSGSQTLTNKTINATNNTISNIDNAAIKSGAAIDATKIANGSVSSTEFQYLDGVTSAIQTQLDTKQALITVVTPGAYPYTALNNTIVLIDCSSARSIQLPAPSANFKVTLKDSTGQAGTNNITVLRNGSEQIEGIAASRTLSANWGAWTFVSNGTNWFMI